MKFDIVRKDNGPSCPPTHYEATGITSYSEAQTFITAANRKLRALPGYQHAWHPYAIEVRMMPSEAAVVEEIGLHAFIDLVAPQFA